MTSSPSLAFLVSHSDGRLGKVDILQSYLRDRGFEIRTILHPLENYAELDTYIEPEDGGTTTITRRALGPLSYIIDTFISIRQVWRSDVALYVGLSNLDVLPAILLRKLHLSRLRKIIYIPSDYSGKRFKNPILNWIYIAVEKAAVRNADLVASNTNRAEAKRLDLGLTSNKSVIIPNGVRINPVAFPAKRIKKDAFIYVGDVSQEHGLYELIQTLGNSMNKLVLIGSGPDWDKTLNLTREYAFSTEAYYKKSRDFVLAYLKSFSGFGLAPYNDSAEWTFYCSPVKVGEYIACGLPVLMSKRPEVSAVVENKGYGITYDQLDRVPILKQIQNFDTTNYSRKARDFYSTNNITALLDKLRV